ncbi:hypothetical protein C2G38_2033929 [Gigaspora rosea]|uniref:Peptidase S1 domain-containing protein n=1 Tax=Gigaspora rosea TaxID=44941 RepID=A0A397VLY7_9GLOM|nr:hypothetical protein C2G38_2033929 [Gigaspora rosea]
MRNIHLLLNLLLIVFTLNKYSLVHAKEALAELWDVEDSELLNLLAIEEKLTAADKTLQLLLENYDSSFGGTYLDVKNRTVYVNTVDFSVVPIIINSSELIHSGYLKFIKFIPAPAKNLMATLTFWFNNIVELIKKLRPVNILAYIDIKLNNVVIYYNLKDEINKRFFKSARKFMPTLLQTNSPINRHSRCNETEISQLQILGVRMIKRRILNGEVIFNEIDRMCSVGFWSKNNKNEDLNYIVTAGHCCVDRSQLFYHLPWNYRRSQDSTQVGEMIESINNFKYEFCLVNITEDVYLPTVIRNTDSEDYRELIIEGGKNITSYSNHLCKSGHITHVTCGYVKELKAVSVHPSGQINMGLIIASKEFFETVCLGDSGGPAFSYLQDLSTASLNAITIIVWYDLSIFLPLHIILSKGGVELVRSH